MIIIRSDFRDQSSVGYNRLMVDHDWLCALSSQQHLLAIPVAKYIICETLADDGKSNMCPGTDEGVQTGVARAEGSDGWCRCPYSS